MVCKSLERIDETNGGAAGIVAREVFLASERVDQPFVVREAVRKINIEAKIQGARHSVSP